MPDVWVGRFSRWVERFFNAKGGPVLYDISPTIQTVLQLDKGQDVRYLEGWNRFLATATQPAVAAVFSAIRWSMPVGVGVITVFESISVQGAAIDQPQLLILAPGPSLGTAVTPIRADARQQPLPTLSGTRGTNASQVGNLAIIGQITANGPPYQFIQTTNQEIVLLPGDSLTVWSNAVNLALTASFVWRERALEQSEFV